MNPNTVLGQSVASSIFLTALAILDRPALSLAFATTGLLWWMVLNRSYALALERRARTAPSRAGRTQRRTTGDRNMARQTVLANVIPIAIAVLCLWLKFGIQPELGPLAARYVQGFVALLAAIVLFWLASSHVDWYYIRPRLDGVVGDPPCVTSGDTRWKGVTRNWYIHRSVASAATMIGAIAFAALLTITLDDVAENVLAAIGGFSAIVGVALFVMRKEIAAVPSMVEAFRSPTHMLGDDLNYDTDFWIRRGYVLHVSVPKTKFVKLDQASGAPATPHQRYEEPTTTMFSVRLAPTVFTGCATGCRLMNPECVHDRARPVLRRTRVLVL